jgi:hypothetical protein
VPRRERSDSTGIVRGELVWRDDESAVQAIRKCCNLTLGPAAITDVDHAQFDVDWCECLNRSE